MSSPRMLALAALLASVVFGSVASAQAPALDVFYSRLEPKTAFKYKWKGDPKTCNVGIFRWEVPESVFSTGGLDRNFTGFCAEVNVPMFSGRTYSFEAQNLLTPAAYGIEATPEGVRATERRATLIRELFGRRYLAAPTPEQAFAMQVALWELAQDTEPAKEPVKFDVFAGDFQADYSKDTAPAFVLEAQKYLDELTGDDTPFYSNQAVGSRELILLRGVANAEGVVAQSQFALRYVNANPGGAGAFGGGGGGGGGGGLPGLGGGAGGGGFGGGTGGGTGGGAGGGGFFGGSGNGGNRGGNGSDVGGGTGGGDDDGSGDGDGGGDGSGDGGGDDNNNRPPVDTPPDNVTTPVPAPAGIVLGLVAVGALATRRFFLKPVRKN